MAGSCLVVRDRGQQMLPPSCQGPHGDSRDRRQQHRAVLRSVLPESRGVPGEVTAGRGPRSRCAIFAVWLPATRGVAPPLSHRGGCATWGPVRQCVRACSSGGGRVGAALGSPVHSSAPDVWHTGPACVAGAPPVEEKGVAVSYQWPCSEYGLWRVSHCSTTFPACLPSTRRCRPR